MFRGLIPGFFHARKARLDQDRDQHHLASMLISVAAGGDEVSRTDIATFLRGKDLSPAQVVVRMNHAVGLAGTAVTGETYDRVVALAREFTATA